MKYLIISASLNPNSRSRVMGSIAEKNFKNKGEVVEFLDIKNIFVFFVTGITILVYLAKRKELFETLIIFSYPTYFLIPLIIEPLPVYYFDLYAISFMIFFCCIQRIKTNIGTNIPKN